LGGLLMALRLRGIGLAPTFGYHLSIPCCPLCSAPVTSRPSEAESIGYAPRSASSSARSFNPSS